jgi:hypothetical protein
MLQLAVDKGVRTWVVPYPMKDCGKASIPQSRWNCLNFQAQAVTALKEGDGTVKYRQVLKQVSNLMICYFWRELISLKDLVEPAPERKK